MIGDLSIAGGRLCRGCPRLDSILVGLDRLARLQPLEAADCEDMAMLVCGRCVSEVACEREAGAWVLSLAPAATVRLS